MPVDDDERKENGGGSNPAKMNMDSIKRQNVMQNPMDGDINEQSLMRNKGGYEGQQTQAKPGDFDDTGLVRDQLQMKNNKSEDRNEIKIESAEG